MDDVINYSNKTLNVGCPEGLLGNFICDLSLFYINQNENQKYKADFCILNNGGFRSSINKGEITRSDIYELMPFNNYLVIIELNQNDMELLLDYIIEKSISNISRKSGVPVSGIRLKIDRFNKIKRCMINNIEFDTNKTYNVLTTDYLANGGDNMSFFKECKKYESKLLLRKVIIEYIETIALSNIKIDAEIDGRITISQ
jgi:2',3'-cyclic-nucleotide 2'-phosphodiesterase (5'-nucleotidase family)